MSAEALAGIANDPPGDLRFHTALPYWRPDGNRPELVGTWPALLAIVRGPDGRLVTLHRTWLAADGQGKAPVPTPRKLCPPGRPDGLRGAAVRLYAATDRLALAEGIETALAVRLACGWPVWSCVSAGGMAAVIVPDIVREVMIAADFDRAGINAAEALAQRLTAEGRRARVAVPDRPGTDFADLVEVAA